MNRNRRRSLAGGLSLLGFVLTLAAAQDVEGQVVRGRVFDTATGRVVPSAVLRLVDGAGEVRQAFAADSTGVYVIALPEAGTYRVSAERLGYERYQSEPFEVREAADVVTIDVGLRPTPIPISGVEVTTDRVNRRLREFLGLSPGQLRIKPILSATIRDHAARGNGLSEMIRWQQIPNLQVLPSRDGACYQFRGRGCMPVYLDGARLTRAPNSSLPLEMLGTVVVLLPSEVIAYPAGAVLVFTTGFMR